MNDDFENEMSELFLNGKVVHIPCISHIIQLVVKDILGKRLIPSNETIETIWTGDQELSELELLKANGKRGIAYLLAIVSFKP